MPGTQRQNARKRRNRGWAGGAGGAGGAGAMAAAPRQTDTKNPVSDIFVCLCFRTPSSQNSPQCLPFYLIYVDICFAFVSCYVRPSLSLSGNLFDCCRAGFWPCVSVKYTFRRRQVVCIETIVLCLDFQFFLEIKYGFEAYLWATFEFQIMHTPATFRPEDHVDVDFELSSRQRAFWPPNAH